MLPHRSLGRKGFIVLLLIIAGVSLWTGAALYSRGAWPVMGLFALDLLLISAAFRLNYRAGRVYEMVELSGNELTLTRVHPSGYAQCWTFNPYWVRLELEEGDARAKRLRLRSHGRVLTFGQFLSNEEKRGFAAALGAALCDARGTRI